MRTMRIGVFGLVCTLLTVGLGGCGSGDEVVLYVSADDYVAREVVAAFEKKTGIRVKVVGDTEAAKTTGLAQRLKDEQSNPQADVFWSSEVFMTIQLAEEGVFEPYTSTVTTDWPGPKDAENRWHGFASRARAIVYPTDRIKPEELPRTWMELSQEKWKDRIAMADPRFGTTRGHMGAMKAYWDRSVAPGFYTAYLQGLAANNIRVLPSGNAGVVRAVASGEVDLGMTDTDDVWAAKRNGAKVDLVYPAHGLPGETGTGTLLIPNTAGLVRGGPNPEHAKALMDFLLSEETERILAESDSHNVPVRPDLAKRYLAYAIADTLRIDYDLVADTMDEAVAEAVRTLMTDATRTGGE